MAGGYCPTCVESRSESENATGSESLDRTDSNDVTQAGGAEESGVTHATEESGVGKLGAFTGVLDRCLADGDGDHVANDHHQSHLRRPGHGCGCDGEQRGQHASQ